MKDLLKKFENKKPEIVFEWSDPETEAEGWAVINSLRGGAAGGGTRMRVGLDKREVESLAKTMEIKFTVSGPQIGGAKSGINFDPNDPRKNEVLKRWYKAVYPLLKNYYGTGGDLNVDEIHEVIPITEGFGLWHPQEGVVNGHFNPPKPQKIHMIGRLRQGVSKILEDQNYIPTSDKKYTVSDMITGFGVAESVRHYYQLWGGDITQKKAIIQGWGNVGATAALYLSYYGAKIVGIIDRDGGIINENGLGLEEIKKLFYDRQGNKLIAEDQLSFAECNEKIWNIGGEIFIPAAASRLVTQDQVEGLISHGLEVVACGANVPFKDDAIFYGPIAEYVDERAALITDFISNCGMARTFAYLMDPKNDKKITDDEIFTDISKTIATALDKVYQQNPGKTGLGRAAFEIALSQLI
ncbi:Glu/Leu/Phe/Val dehydrogenase dimerization domain-containing protein [Marinoscillum sp. 108]|jgi:glutamate dehydrogenase/leucine dehydrogenase|uniref:Glu/Leu/Phe/Val dehydrogenase dimerization domain-containing protein n=1 Tax=Marinoscillum luteum TaxID=861051 RepID=A0ABW7NA31_9BACT|nr:Glu/Leu/Phe/Val dehydrogenase dimerization domain-containing protein [Marinoscillum sp. 108]VXD18654.1 Glutamate dehydrogenase/leucine dehydrogenase [Marinoscillum sp. 108]